MYGFKDRITENVLKEGDLKQDKIIDLDNYETEVKYLICKLLHALKIKNVDPKKIKMTEKCPKNLTRQQFSYEDENQCRTNADFDADAYLSACFNLLGHVNKNRGAQKSHR